MKNENNKNFIPAAYRILFLLNLLTKKDMTLKEIEEKFSQNEDIQCEIRKETLLKYLKTLNLAGYKIEKNGNKYGIKEFPTKLNLSNSSINTLINLQKFIQGLYRHKLSVEYSEFITHISKYLTKEKLNKISNLKNDNRAIFKEYLHYKDILTTIDEYLNKGRKLEITTLYQKKILLDSPELDYYDKEIFLSGYNKKTKELTSIPVETITKINLSSQVSSKINIYPSITFKLKGKLSHNYKLKTNEKILSYDKEKQELIILNTKEDKNLLFRRIIRYGLLCELQSPKYIKEEFKDFISQMRKNYQ